METDDGANLATSLSVVDIEIEETKALIDLYKAKIDLLR